MTLHPVARSCLINVVEMKSHVQIALGVNADGVRNAAQAVLDAPGAETMLVFARIAIKSFADLDDYLALAPIISYQQDVYGAIVEEFLP